MDNNPLKHWFDQWANEHGMPEYISPKAQTIIEEKEKAIQKLHFVQKFTFFAAALSIVSSLYFFTLTTKLQDSLHEAHAEAARYEVQSIQEDLDKLFIPVSYSL